MGKSLSSLNFYQGEKKDVTDLYNLLVEYKETDLADCDFPTEFIAGGSKKLAKHKVSTVPN